MNNDIEYRVIQYDGRWHAEKLKSQGVWSIIGDFDTKEAAEAAIKVD